MWRAYTSQNKHQKILRKSRNEWQRLLDVQEHHETVNVEVTMIRYQGMLINTHTKEIVFWAPAFHDTYKEAEEDARIAQIHPDEEICVRQQEQ
ncbi:hypothetical protein HS371_73 [Klebsiella phage vB_KpP_HS37]|nr:hypothetical protein HS371_73 [Klebsiella phage vB_KpP_HS37]